MAGVLGEGPGSQPPLPNAKLRHFYVFGVASPGTLVLSIVYLHCALASCSAVCCNRSCLYVCGGRVGRRCPNRTTASAHAVFASLSECFFHVPCFTQAILMRQKL